MKLRHVAGLLMLLAASCVLGADQLANAELQRRLTSDLTPLGAERAGNAQGTIPPWTGGMTTPPPGWNPQQGYVDPFPEDAPLFRITRENWQNHRDNLTPGLIALLQRVDGFYVQVFPTRRTAAVPKSIAAEVLAQAGNTALDGVGVNMKHYHPVPFPVPQSGLEAIWNHLLRYLGGGIERSTHAFPVRPSGDYYRIGFHSRRIYENNMDTKTENRLFAAMGEYTEPATLLGTTFLVHEPLNQLKERRSAWIYNAGLRRVRRAPDLGYDGIPDGSEGMFTADQIDAYNGSPERYEWTLQGKNEYYVPYNTYRFGAKGQKDADFIRRGTVNPALMRYELHRVWVVEARLKSGESHIYGKRVFYLDEDSWSILAEDAYSTRGDLWRVALHGLIQYYDAQVPWYRLSIYHDLQSGAYFLGGLDNGIEAPIRFGIRGRLTDFQADALRRAGTH
jgi:hypothetical protein